jgi:hypothetical protein
MDEGVICSGLTSLKDLREIIINAVNISSLWILIQTNMTQELYALTGDARSDHGKICNDKGGASK